MQNFIRTTRVFFGRKVLRWIWEMWIAKLISVITKEDFSIWFDRGVGIRKTVLGEVRWVHLKKGRKVVERHCQHVRARVPHITLTRQNLLGVLLLLMVV